MKINTKALVEVAEAVEVTRPFELRPVLCIVDQCTAVPVATFS